MCYDISFTTSIESIFDYFPDLVMEEQLAINFEMSAHIIGHGYKEHPVVFRSAEDNLPHLKLMEWGIIPFYTKDEEKFKRQRASMLNIRSERILDDKISYWYKIRNRRCLVPVTGIFEHRGIVKWKNKVPYLVQLKQQPLFLLPGLYSVVELPDIKKGEIVKRWTYAIITRGANDTMKNIHNDGDNKWRMPLFLPKDLTQQWIDADLSETAYRDILNYEMPSEELATHPVFSIRTTKPHPNDGLKTDVYEWADLPVLGSCNPE